jgi:hypothetical protein
MNSPEKTKMPSPACASLRVGRDAFSKHSFSATGFTSEFFSNYMILKSYL